MVSDVMSVFCIDPGETTGWACLDVSRKRLRDLGVPSYKCVLDWEADEVSAVGVRPVRGGRELDGGEPYAALKLVQLIEERRPTVLVVEDFILDVTRATPDRNLLSPVRITAMVELALRMSSVASVRGLGAPNALHFQTASDAKSVITNKRLERWGFYIPRKQLASTHCRDAVRHGLLYIRNVRKDRSGSGLVRGVQPVRSRSRGSKRS